jgi:hypothetical protein
MKRFTQFSFTNVVVLRRTITLACKRSTRMTRINIIVYYIIRHDIRFVKSNLEYRIEYSFNFK